MAENDSKPTEPVAGQEGAGDSKGVAEKASETASTVKENVFSMFGGGPKKEKREEQDDVDEPSGSSKKQAAAGDEVRCFSHVHQHGKIKER